ncbi:MAG: NAD(P)-dependent oxidoreductase [Planctomycetaceae bacterium]|nr:NAD(P)-dependent oxidoreductase [Planctomycetaceae bacterium]
MKTVAITGALGNLGWKFVQHMSAHADVRRVIGLDLHVPSSEQLGELSAVQTGKCEFVSSDLLDWQDRRWRDAVDRSDAVVHFAAQNPFPEASWDDANRSLDMTLNVALASVDVGVGRFVFVSSNHVMGRYKNSPLADTIGTGELTTSLEHAVGTVWQVGEREMDSTPYAVAKSSGERLCQALGTRADGRTTFVSVRVGWCQPGENEPATLSAAGTPTQAIGIERDADFERADLWFRHMWLSNRDFAQLFERAVLAKADTWPEPSVVVNGVSGNTGMAWSLDEAQRYLGYAPQDDVEA